MSLQYINVQITPEMGNFTQENITAILEAAMGEQRRDMVSVAVLTFVYVLIFISGIAGNICTCIVIARNAYMHTATNYYLFSLAVSDMLTLLFGLPAELYGIWEAYPWRFGEPFCFLKSFLSEMTSYASVMTITAFTVERYVAICHPIKAQTLSNLSRAIKIVFGIWVLSSLCALPYPIHTRVFSYITLNGTPLEDSVLCNVPYKWQAGMTYAFQISTFVFFVFPMAIITILYALIGTRLSKSGFIGTDSANRKFLTKTKARKAVIRMLVAVVVAFFLQWAPFHAQRLMTSYVPLEMWTPSLIRFQSDLFYVSGVLYFCNSTVNPILYNIMSKKFRLAFKRTLCRCCYTPGELLELNGKSKSVYCSDRHSGHGARRLAHNVTKLSFSDVHGCRNETAILKPDLGNDIQYMVTGNGSATRTRCNPSISSSKLNDFLYGIGDLDIDSRSRSTTREPSRPKFYFSPGASDSSEADSIIELKSLSSAYSAGQSQTTRVTIPCSTSFQSKRASFV